MTTVKYFKFDPRREANRDAPILKKSFKKEKDARAFAQAMYNSVSWEALHADSLWLIGLTEETA